MMYGTQSEEKAIRSKGRFKEWCPKLWKGPVGVECRLVSSQPIEHSVGALFRVFLHYASN